MVGMRNTSDEITQMVDEIKKRYARRRYQIAFGQRDETAHVKDIINHEIIRDIEYGEENGFPDVRNADAGKLFITPEMFNYASNRTALRQLIEVAPAFAVLASSEITNDERNLESFSRVSPMSIVYLYGEGKIDKSQFLKEVHRNPSVLQNYCVYGEYGLVDQEMLDAALYQEGNKDFYDRGSNAWLGYEVFRDCIEHDFKDYMFSDKQIEYVAKHAISGFNGGFEKMLAQNLDREGRYGEYEEQVKRMLIKYPQAIKAMDPEEIENFDDRSEQIRYEMERTEDPTLREEYKQSLAELEKLVDNGHLFWRNISEAMQENPQVRTVFFMNDEEFSDYMKGVEQGRETGDTKESIKQRIKKKSDEYRRLRDRNNRKEF